MLGDDLMRGGERNEFTNQHLKGIAERIFVLGIDINDNIEKIKRLALEISDDSTVYEDISESIRKL